MNAQLARDALLRDRFHRVLGKTEVARELSVSLADPEFRYGPNRFNWVRFSEYLSAQYQLNPPLTDRELLYHLRDLFGFASTDAVARGRVFWAIVLASNTTHPWTWAIQQREKQTLEEMVQVIGRGVSKSDLHDFIKKAHRKVL